MLYCYITDCYTSDIYMFTLYQLYQSYYHYILSTYIFTLC